MHQCRYSGDKGTIYVIGSNFVMILEKLLALILLYASACLQTQATRIDEGSTVFESQVICY